MAKSLNKVMLIGNVGSEPEIRTTASGKRVAKLSLATNRSFTDRSGQQQEKTEWHRLTAGDRLADLFEQYVHKGDRLYVEGSIEYSQTEDEQGKPRYWTDIVVRDMVMLSGRGGGEADRGGEDWGGGGARRRQSAPAQAQPSSPFADDDDDLPF